MAGLTWMNAGSSLKDALEPASIRPDREKLLHPPRGDSSRGDPSRGDPSSGDPSRDALQGQRLCQLKLTQQDVDPPSIPIDFIPVHCLRFVWLIHSLIQPLEKHQQFPSARSDPFIPHFSIDSDAMALNSGALDLLPFIPGHPSTIHQTMDHWIMARFSRWILIRTLRKNVTGDLNNEIFKYYPPPRPLPLGPSHWARGSTFPRRFSAPIFRFLLAKSHRSSAHRIGSFKSINEPTGW